MMFTGHSLYTMIKMVKDNKKIVKKDKKDKKDKIQIKHWHGLRAAQAYHKNK